MIRATIFAAAMTAFFGSAASAADWILAPSTFTHDPATGERVSQFAPIEPVYVQSRPDYLRSGYRHNRSSIYSGEGADHHHVVEQWGRPVRPYGEWLYPYRPYSVPYHLWGPPYAGLNLPGFGRPWRGGAGPRGRDDFGVPDFPFQGERDFEDPRAPLDNDFRPPRDGARGPTGYGSGRT
jgi:hypothetical protein